MSKQAYLQLAKGFIHEANEPLEVLERDGKFLVILYNEEWENYSVIILRQSDKTIPFKHAFKTLKGAKALFNLMSCTMP